MRISLNISFLAVITTAAMASSIGCGKRDNACFDVQGHRGARSLWPENSIPGFEYATALGVTTLEMDVVVLESGDVLVSHEPWLNPLICTSPNRKAWAVDSVMGIYHMPLSEIQKCDCGSLGNAKFPAQRRVPTFKPTLNQVVEAVSKVERPSGMLPVRFNIEIKFNPLEVGQFYPEAAEAAKTVLAVLRHLDVLERSTVQSFSAEVMEAVQAEASGVATAWLMEEDMPVEEALGLLSFLPDVYSPQHALLTAEEVMHAHRLGVKVLPWTVNEVARMRELIGWGVDGLITDDPALAIEVASVFAPAQ